MPGPQATATAPLRLAKANPDSIIPKMGLDELMGSNYINIAIFLAILIALVHLGGTEQDHVRL